MKKRGNELTDASSTELQTVGDKTFSRHFIESGRQESQNKGEHEGVLLHAVIELRANEKERASRRLRQWHRPQVKARAEMLSAGVLSYRTEQPLRLWRVS